MYDNGFTSGILQLLLFFSIIPFFLILIISKWKIYKKAGKEGWESIIPIYSSYVLLKIAGKPGWWLFLFLIPLVNVIFYIMTIHALSKSFGKNEGFTIGLILLGFIFYPILAFSNATYTAPNQQ